MTHQIPKFKCLSSHLAVVFAQSIEAGCEVENEVVGAVPTGDALTTSEWSTILVPIKVRVILETWRCVKQEIHWLDNVKLQGSAFTIIYS